MPCHLFCRLQLYSDSSPQSTLSLILAATCVSSIILIFVRPLLEYIISIPILSPLTLHFLFLFSLYQGMIPSSHLVSGSISPRARLLIEKAADFITHRVMPAEITVLNHTYVHTHTFY